MGVGHRCGSSVTLSFLKLRFVDMVQKLDTGAGFSISVKKGKTEVHHLRRDAVLEIKICFFYNITYSYIWLWNSE